MTRGAHLPAVARAHAAALDERTMTVLRAHADDHGRVTVSRAVLAAALGYTLTPTGKCNGLAKRLARLETAGRIVRDPRRQWTITVVD